MAGTENVFTAQGECVAIRVTPIEGDAPSKTLNVQYGLWTVSKEGEVDKVSSRFEVTGMSVVEGREVAKVLRGHDAAKFVDRMINDLYGMFDMTEADVSIEVDIENGFENDYFKQKMIAKKPVETIWNAEDKAALDDLNLMRSEVEAALEEVQIGEVATQADRYNIGSILLRVYTSETIGKNRKRMASWANGASESSNLPLLTQLGKGEHALTEAMYIAQISSECREALPFSISSGKGIKLHQTKAVSALVDSVTTLPVIMPIVVDDEKFPDIGGIGDILRSIADKSFGVSGAVEKTDSTYNLSLIEVVAAVNDSMGAYISDYDVNYGKHVNTYDKDSYAASLMHFGRVYCSGSGAGLFANAVDAIMTLNEAEELDTAKLAKLFNTHGNLMLRSVLTKMRLHQKTIATEANNRDLLKDTDLDDGPISKKAAVAYSKLPALAAAAHLFKLLNTHPEAGDVLANFNSLVRQSDVKNVEKMQAA